MRKIALLPSNYQLQNFSGTTSLAGWMHKVYISSSVNTGISTACSLDERNPPTASVALYLQKQTVETEHNIRGPPTISRGFACTNRVDLLKRPEYIRIYQKGQFGYTQVCLNDFCFNCFLFCCSSLAFHSNIHILLNL